MFVKAHRECGAGAWSKAGEGRKRHHFASIVSHVKRADIFSSGSIVAFRLNIGLPLPSKAVEIVDEQPAHECLQGLVHVFDCNALLYDFLAVDIRVQLRHAGQIRGAQTSEFWAFPGFGEKGLTVRGKKDVTHASTIFKHESESAA